MKRRVLAPLVTAGLLLVGPAGCGIPGQTDVRVDGGGQPPNSGPVGVTGREAPRRMDSGEDVKKFASNFLLAAAGEASTADDRVREFLSPTDRQGLPESRDAPINLVRLVEGEPTVTPSEGTSTVSIAVQQVGVLRPNGVLQPPVLTDTSYTFRVGNLEDGDLGKRDEAAGFYVYDPPPGVLLMSVDALTEYYEQQVIYFWSREDRPRLVPDLRYLPVSVPIGRRPTEVLGWLTGGPADWLKGSVAELPPGTKTIGNAPANDGRLVVNLAGPPLQEPVLSRLSTQLAWSLRDAYLRGRVEVMIRDKSVRVFDVDEQRRQNPVYPVESLATSYCVLAGSIHRVAGQSDLPVEPPPIAAGRNRDIESAAIARYRGSVLAALVTSAGRLAVGSGGPTVTNFATSNKPVGRQARPVWLRGFDAAVGLVVVDGRLHRFDVEAQLVPLRLPGTPGAVTAVSAALDGRRIAVIAGNRLFVASMNAETREVIQVRPVPVSLRRPTAVAWVSESQIEVVGQNRRGRTALVDVTVDGGAELPRLDDLGRATVDYLAAYPADPVRSEGPQVMYEANGALWTIWSGGSPSRIGVDQLEGVDGRSAGDARPTAPFFLF